MRKIDTVEQCSGGVERMPIADEIAAVLNELVCRELMPSIMPGFYGLAGSGSKILGKKWRLQLEGVIDFSCFKLGKIL